MDGKVVVKPGSGVTVEEVETQMAITRNQVRSLSQICNGSLNEENRTAASRNWIARFMTAHRGWLVLAAQRLWKRRGFNFQTMQEEEGLSITLKNMIAKTFSLASESGMKNIIDVWNENKDNMNEVEKLISNASVSMPAHSLSCKPYLCFLPDGVMMMKTRKVGLLNSDPTSDSEP